MSKKISDYFKMKPKSKPDYVSIQESLETFSNIKNEPEGNYVINLDVIELSEIRDCRVVVQDINKRGINEIKLNDIKIKSGLCQEDETKVKVKLKQGKITPKLQHSECEFCGQKILKNNIFDHMKRKHPEAMKDFPDHCQICDERFITLRSLKMHINKMHSEILAPKMFECDFDGKTFKTKAQTLSHMGCHQSKVKCELCHTELVPHHLKRHIRNVHTKELKFQCKVCQKSFKSNLILKDHLQFHNKSYQCSICLRKFALQGQINQHLKYDHQNPNNFQCEICGRKFNYKSDCKKHQKTHDKFRTKRYKCQRCDYATDQNPNLKVHQKTHEYQDKRVAAMKNPIKCEICTKLCKNQLALKYHMKFVHPKVLCQCDLCGNYYKTKDYLTKHIKEKHL